MYDITEVKHSVQKYILSILIYRHLASFSDLLPPKTSTNLFSYHLKLMQKSDLILKSNNGYELSPKGLAYIDRYGSGTMHSFSQPKIITMLVVQNSDGDILLMKRKKQPYIDKWSLPYAKLQLGDRSIAISAQRVVKNKLGLDSQSLVHAGDCYIRVNSDEGIISSTLAHVFSFNSDSVQTGDDLIWARPHKLHQYKLAPAVEQIITRTFFRDPYYFEEFSVDW